MDRSPPDSSVHGILQARILEWVVMPSSRGSFWPRDWTCVFMSPQFSPVQSLSHVQLFVTPWTAACQASPSITNSWSLLKLMSIDSVIPSISSSVVPFCLQSFPASGSFPMSQFFASGGQSIGVSASASVLPMNIHDWFPLGWTGWISLQSKGLSRAFSNTKVQKHQFLDTQLSFYVSSRVTKNSLLLSKDKKWYKGRAEDWFRQVGNMAEICTQNIHWVTQRNSVCLIFWKWWANEETRAVMPSDLGF